MITLLEFMGIIAIESNKLHLTRQRKLYKKSSELTLNKFDMSKMWLSKAVKGSDKFNHIKMFTYNSIKTE